MAGGQIWLADILREARSEKRAAERGDENVDISEAESAYISLKDVQQEV